MCCSDYMSYVCLRRLFRYATISFQFCFFFPLVFCAPVLPMNTKQVAVAREITEIKCTTLKVCYHVDLFSDTRKTRAISQAPDFALTILQLICSKRMTLIGNGGCVVSQFPPCWLALSFTSLLYTDIP
jgi:hypothetical protein